MTHRARQKMVQHVFLTTACVAVNGCTVFTGPLEASMRVGGSPTSPSKTSEWAFPYEDVPCPKNEVQRAQAHYEGGSLRFDDASFRLAGEFVRRRPAVAAQVFTDDPILSHASLSDLSDIELGEAFLVYWADKGDKIYTEVLLDLEHAQRDEDANRQRAQQDNDGSTETITEQQQDGLKKIKRSSSKRVASLRKSFSSLFRPPDHKAHSDGGSGKQHFVKKSSSFAGQTLLPTQASEAPLRRRASWLKQITAFVKPQKRATGSKQGSSQAAEVAQKKGSRSSLRKVSTQLKL